jgi:hypothetical protein
MRIKLCQKRDHLIDVDVDVKVVLKSILKKWDVKVWSGVICLNIGAIVRLL